MNLRYLKFQLNGDTMIDIDNFENNKKLSESVLQNSRISEVEKQIKELNKKFEDFKSRYLDKDVEKELDILSEKIFLDLEKELK